MENERLITARFPGTCSKCNARIPAGSPIMWAPGGGSVRHVGDCPPPPLAELQAQADPKPVVDLKPVADFLMAAQARGLRFPKARFLSPNGGELRLNVAGSKARVPGAVQVVENDRWLGRVNPDGQVVGPLASDEKMITTLHAITADPAKAASEFGALMGRCSFCDLALTDEGSVEVGYGPICAKRFGLPHKPKGTPALKAVA